MKFKFSLLQWLWICVIILLCGILYFDLRVYKQFVLNINEKINEVEVANLFLLKTPLLEKAVEEIQKKEEFLQNPKFPLIKDQF